MAQEMTFDPLGDADAKLERELAKTNVLVMMMAWVAMPKFREYLGVAIEKRVRKLFTAPLSSIFHATRHKPEH